MLTASPAGVARRVRFETVPRDAADVLPRMDVAAFVGFAASGPVHVPVVVEDTKQYTAIFGDNAPLAWDTDRGETVCANLGPAVRAFFANGGRRCWVIRVAAASATHNYFPVPGLLKRVSGAAPVPAFARARSEGSWSDTLGLEAALRATSFPATGIDAAAMQLAVAGAGVPRSALPAAGDLLRLQFKDAGSTTYTLFARVAASPSADPALATDLTYPLAEAHWFADSPVVALDPSDAVVGVSKYVAVDAAPFSARYFPDDPYSETACVSHEETLTARLRAGDDGASRLVLEPTVKVQVGEMLRIVAGADQGWFVVRQTGIERDDSAASPPGPGVAVLVADGELFWCRDGGPLSLDPDPLRAEIVTFDLRVASDSRNEMTAIGCTPAHSRYWGALAGDRCRYRPRPRTSLNALATEARDGAFAFASSDGQGAAIYLPLGMRAELSSSVHALTQTGLALQRDGLESYDASLFLDPDLESTSTTRLMPEADYLRHFASRPRPLCGMHAVLGFGQSTIADEVTLLSVPDAVHRGWRPATLPDDDIPEGVPEPQAEVATGEFENCLTPVLAAPVLTSAGAPDTRGLVRLTWGVVDGARYELEEAAGAGFADVSTAYAGHGNAIELHRPAGGAYRYRVRASLGGQVSAWSDPLTVLVPAAISYVFNPATESGSPEPEVLRDIHRALLRLSAAQGELFSVLSVPRHFREQETQTYLATLSAEFAAERAPSPLSYGAIYHPWLQTRTDASAIVTQPPDGAIVGSFAARAVARGAWVAPANQPLKNVVALTPLLPTALESSVALNLIHNEPRGFLALRADTLETVDTDLRQINVRRLLILLRRLALRHGAAYAFEPNGDALRRLVQRRFENLLHNLYDRGAFAGYSPASSYQVDTGPEVNTPQSESVGQFLVALRVCPSLPMEFITVRLVQAGDRLAVSEVH
jgi:hypothetical protein